MLMNNMFDYLVSKNLGMHKTAGEPMLRIPHQIKNHPGKLIGWMEDQINAANEYDPRVQPNRTYINKGKVNRFGRNLRDVGMSFLNGMRGQATGGTNDLLDNGSRWLEYKINNGDFERGGQRLVKDLTNSGLRAADRMYKKYVPRSARQTFMDWLRRYGVTSDAKE